MDDSTQTDIPPPPSADSDSSSEGLLSESSSESELPEEEDEEPVIRTHKKASDYILQAILQCVKRLQQVLWTTTSRTPSLVLLLLKKNKQGWEYERKQNWELGMHQ